MSELDASELFLANRSYTDVLDSFHKYLHEHIGF